MPKHQKQKILHSIIRYFCEDVVGVWMKFVLQILFSPGVVFKAGGSRRVVGQCVSYIDASLSCVLFNTMSLSMTKYTYISINA